MYKTREEVKSWLEEMYITNYVINEDLTVDVQGNVDLSFKGLNNLTVKFGIVNGNFNCGNNQLTNLEGCPQIVKGHFNCFNNNLTSLEGCPQKVAETFNCSHNHLTSLEYFPKEIKCGFIYMGSNRIKEEELFNFNCNIEKVINIYSDFNEKGYKEEFLEKVNYYKKIKKENELLTEISKNSNNIKLNKKL